MRELKIAQFITLDGVIQAPGGANEDTDGGFASGGWTWPYWNDAIGAHFFALMEETDALLLGRRTWEIHGGAFEPVQDDPIANAMNGIQKYVVSTTLTSTAAWRNSTLISSNVVEEMRKLKQASGKTIMLDGSSVLSHTLIENDLVDEYLLHVYPLVLGGGKRLFPDGKQVKLTLIESQPLASGVVYQRFRPADSK